jgi:hypothetical protein
MLEAERDALRAKLDEAREAIREYLSIPPPDECYTMKEWVDRCAASIARLRKVVEG